MNLSFKLFGRHFKFLFRTHKDLDQYMSGITNKCADGRYIIFLDYDGVPLEWVVEELRFLTHEHFLGDAHVFKTGNGYHAIINTKVFLRELVEIMRETSTDEAYKWVPLRRAQKVWTLRTSEKNGEVPEHVMTVRGNNLPENEESKPHNDILRKLYSLEIPTTREDDEDEFLSAHYHIARG